MIKSHQHLDLSNIPIIEKVELTPPFSLSAEMSHDACFMASLNGSTHVIGAQGREDLKPNEALVMKCGNFVQQFLENEKNDNNEIIVIHFYPDVLKAIFKNDFPEILKTPEESSRVLIQKLEMDTLLKNYIESLLFYFENPSVVNEELIRLKLKELILLLSKTEQRADIRAMLADLFNPQRHNFKSTIEQNLYESLSMEELANLTAMSVSSFKRKFKEVFGESPARYIKLKKLEKAAQLLRVSQQRVSDICFQCGFNDLGHFSKSFVQQYGQSPSEYRTSVA